MNIGLYAKLAVAIAIVALLVLLPGDTLRSADSQGTTEVRIAAQKLTDGRVEFALQQRLASGAWGDRVLPRQRNFPAAISHQRWLNSAPVELTVTAPSPFGTLGEIVGTPTGLGEAATAGNWEFRVLSVTPDATDRVQAHSDSAGRPLDGWQFMLVEVEIKWLGDGSERPSRFLNLGAVGEQRTLWSFWESSATSGWTGCGEGLHEYSVPDAIDMTAELFSGGSVRGNICGVVPTAEVESGLFLVADVHSRGNNYSSTWGGDIRYGAGRSFLALQNTVSSLDSTVQTELPQSLEVRILARMDGNNRLEFALQQQSQSGRWGERILPDSRYFSLATRVGRWLSSTPLEIQTRQNRLHDKVNNSIDNPIPFGELASVGLWEVSISGGPIDSTEEILEKNATIEEPEAGFGYFTVKVGVTNTGKGSGVLAYRISFGGLGMRRVVRETGHVFTACGDRYVWDVVSDPIYPEVHLFHGGMMEGNVCFVAPKDEVKEGGMILVVEGVRNESDGRLGGGRERVYFELE